MRYLPIALISALLLAACDPAPQPVQQAPEPQAAPAPPPAEGGAVLAIVNGKPVAMAKLYDLLIRGQGLVMSQQLIMAEIVQQAADEKGITLTDADILAESGKLLQGVFATVEEPEQRERMLVQFLNEKQISRQRWDLSVQMNARLRKLAAPRVQVNDKLLRQAFEDQYGRKVLVRHIEMESMNELEKVIQLARQRDADFGRLAQKHSKNPSASQMGQLPPISSLSPAEMPDNFREAALKLKTPGELSDPIKLGYAWHVLRLEKVIDPQNVRFEDVKDKVEATLRDRLIDQGKQLVLNDLMKAAKYEYIDPLLKTLDNQEHSKK